MAGLSARLRPGDHNAAFAAYYRFAEERCEQAALIATDRARKVAIGRLRAAGQGAGLGRLFQGLGSGSDLERGNRVHRFAGGGFSASGFVFIRSGSDRTRGAIEAYTQGAEIAPVRSRWLWIATDEVQRLVGSGSKKTRLTPALWKSSGLEAKVGPLVTIRSVNGYPLLIVKDATVALSGKKRSARARTKTGRIPKGQTAKEFIVAFIGIPRTARAARIDVTAIMRSVQIEMQDMFYQALGRI